MGLEDRDFGEVLRHELNNPLTGILGNAELLLMEVRRGRLELPGHNRQPGDQEARNEQSSWSAGRQSAGRS